LDVGSGAGAACLPLAPRTTALTAVDADEEMLGLLAGRAGEAGLAARTVHGRWPDVAGQTGPARGGTCHHVVVNVPGPGPVLDALTGHARRRVVVETAAAHPLISLNPLWLRFHGLKRPEGPTAADTIGILAAMGRGPRHTEWSRPAAADYQSMAELVEVTRRRLCLPPERAGEVEAVLVELGINPGQPGDLGSSGRDVVTLGWGGSGGRGPRERVAVGRVPGREAQAGRGRRRAGRGAAGGERAHRGPARGQRRGGPGRRRLCPGGRRGRPAGRRLAGAAADVR